MERIKLFTAALLLAAISAGNDVWALSDSRKKDTRPVESPQFFSGNANPLLDFIFVADPTSVEYNGRLYVYGTSAPHGHHPSYRGWNRTVRRMLVNQFTQGLGHCRAPFDPGAVIDDEGTGWVVIRWRRKGGSRHRVHARRCPHCPLGQRPD